MSGSEATTYVGLPSLALRSISEVAACSSLAGWREHFLSDETCGAESPKDPARPDLAFFRLPALNSFAFLSSSHTTSARDCR